MEGLAIIVMAITLYWMLGLCLGLTYALVLTLEGQPIDWGSVAMTVLAWPISVWFSITGGGR